MATGSTQIETNGKHNTSSDGEPSLVTPTLALAFANCAALFHPNPLVLAALGTVLVVSGFAVAAAIAVRWRHDRAHLSDRMVLPALVVFFGFVAAVLSDVDRVTQSLPYFG